MLTIGMQLYDNLGNVTFDLTLDDAVKVLDVVTVNSGGTYTITDARFALGTPFYYTVNARVNVLISFSGNDMLIDTRFAPGGTYTTVYGTI